MKTFDIYFQSLVQDNQESVKMYLSVVIDAHNKAEAWKSLIEHFSHVFEIHIIEKVKSC